MTANNQQIVFFDTTLRDGEQSPGCTMHHSEKLRMAHQLAALGVDVLEAGFAIASSGDLESIRAIAKEVRGSRITSLARCKRDDIEAAARAVESAPVNRIHVFLASSDLHLESKLRISREQALEQAAESVALACRYSENVEFSAEDATRSDPGISTADCDGRGSGRSDDRQPARYSRATRRRMSTRRCFSACSLNSWGGRNYLFDSLP